MKKSIIIPIILIITCLISPATAEHNIEPYNLKITPEYVISNAVCSCTLSKDRKHHIRIFQNKNPITGHLNVIGYEKGPTCPEGMWRIRNPNEKNFDMDFCLVHGKSHDKRRTFLIPYNGIIDGYIVQNGILTDQKADKTPNHIRKIFKFKLKTLIQENGFKTLANRQKNT